MMGEGDRLDTGEECGPDTLCNPAKQSNPDRHYVMQPTLTSTTTKSSSHIVTTMCEEKMSTKSSTSTSIPSGEKSSVDMSESHRRSQMTRIWEWGVDETLWNPDKVSRPLTSYSYY